MNRPYWEMMLKRFQERLAKGLGHPDVQQHVIDTIKKALK